MKTYIKKLKHLLPTYLIIAFSILIGLLVIRWLFAIQYDIIDIKEEIWCLWLPIGLPWIPVLIWLRPRFRILTFKKDNDNGHFFFQILAAGTITACAMVSQNYLTTATGTLQKLSTINEIEKVKKSRYYKFEKFAVTKNYGGSYTDISPSGKHNEHLDFHVFFVMPIIADASEKNKTVPKYWYGVDFRDQISNRITPEEKEDLYDSFYDDCVEKMEHYDFRALDHFERVPTSDNRTYYLKAIESRIKQKAANEFIILEPIKEKFEGRNGNKLAWIFGSFAIGVGLLLFSLIWPGYSERERIKFMSGKKPKQDDLMDMLKYLIPKGDHFVTSILLDLNILVFLVMIFSGISLFSPRGFELLDWGANRRFETTEGAWWRLLTSMFLHGGILHLLLNSIGFVVAAIFVEPLLGRKKYFILYILSGICGSLASIWWYPNTISVGASGAIFGLYGALLGLLLTNGYPDEGKKGLLAMVGIYVGINLLWGLTGGIDNAAHIGGLLSGALIAVVMNEFNEE